MEYKDIREKFAQLSGRYDLINPDTLEDAGADLFLNEGQKFLDNLITLPQSRASYPAVIEAGGFYVRVQRLRAVLKVWATASDGSRTELVKKDISTLREWYGEEYSLITRSAPAYYAPVSFRPYPDTVLTATLAAADAKDYADLITDNTHYAYNGIILLPPADARYTIRIEGLFYSPELSATLSGAVWTQTKSYWTEVHPMTLIDAAIYRLSSFYGDEGVMKLKRSAVTDMLAGMDANVVEEESAGVDQMEG